jgi:uncharacterized coiled-coil DUF342 family protein
MSIDSIIKQLNLIKENNAELKNEADDYKASYRRAQAKLEQAERKIESLEDTIRALQGR